MNKNIWFIIGIIILLVVGNGIYAFLNNKGGVKIEGKEEMMKDDIKKESDMLEKNNESIMGKNDDTVMKVGIYEAYAPEKLARAEAGDVVLFFHASWCPSCRGLNSDIEKNMGAIPEGVSILKTDYDTEIELKKKYGVTYQHTLVQVDKDGNLIKKWSGSPTLSSLVSQIQ